MILCPLATSMRKTRDYLEVVDVDADAEAEAEADAGAM